MNKKIKFKWWYCIILGLCNIIDGLTMIFTIGYFATGLSLKYALYAAKNKTLTNKYRLSPGGEQ